MISSAVWIGADSESALSVSGGRLSPIETDKADSLSDTLHTSAYHTAWIARSLLPLRFQMLLRPVHTHHAGIFTAGNAVF